MPSDNVTLNAGSGGSTLRTLSDSSGDEWPACVLCYATTVSAGANVLQVVTPSEPLPVTGTFWQATQPVSGTVTANASTNLNTSALALESDGNLATIAGRTPALGQALAASAVPVVLTAAQLATLTPLTTVAVTESGTWNIGTVTTVTTVSAVTGITNALPAGTNLLGQVSAADQVANLFNGTTAVTPQYAPITASSSGATTIVSAVAGKKVYILRWSLSSNGNVNANWQSHTTTSTATGLHYLTQYATAGGAYCPAGIFATATGEGLDINLSASVAVGGELTYVQF
jgi:hypothetical protein